MTHPTPPTSTDAPDTVRDAGASVRANTAADTFAQQAEQAQQGLLAEFWDFLKFNKKWWLTPIIVMLLLIGVLLIVAAASPASAPFIYTLF